MRNALSIAAGALWETSVPNSELISRLRLISPSAIVTGNISLSTRRTRSSRQSMVSVRCPPAPAQPRQRQQELDHRAHQHPDRVRVDLVLLAQDRLEPDDRGDDHRFQAIGASAGTLKCSKELSIPTIDPAQREQHDDREHQLGQADRQVRERGVVVEARARTAPMIGRANSTNSAVIDAEQDHDPEEEARGDPEGLLPLALLQQLGEDRDERALQSASRRTGPASRFGTWKAIVNADIAPETPNKLAATTSRTSPMHAREPGREREERGAAREAAALAARRLWEANGVRYTRRAHMANIASQEKRILRTERERDENRRYTSQVKTSFRRLATPWRPATPTRSTTEHRLLASRIDKAVRAGALHRNSGARKKARAARSPAETDYPITGYTYPCQREEP